MPNNTEIAKEAIEEFDRIQDYMMSCEDKDSVLYQKMKRRYMTLKAILTASGVNLTEIDYVKESKKYKTE